MSIQPNMDEDENGHTTKKARLDIAALATVSGSSKVKGNYGPGISNLHTVVGDRTEDCDPHTIKVDRFRGVEDSGSTRHIIDQPATSATLSTTSTLGNAKTIGSAANFFVANIPGLFLLGGGNCSFSPEQNSFAANMDQQAQSELEAQQSSTGDFMMGDHGHEQKAGVVGKLGNGESIEIDDVIMNDEAGSESKTNVSCREPIARETSSEPTTVRRENESANSLPAVNGNSRSENPVQLTTEQAPSEKSIRLVADVDQLPERPQLIEEKKEEKGEKKEEKEGEEEEEEQARRRRGKASYDPEFLAAAEANKGDETAEWQFDSSDAESSEGAESSDSSDEEDSEDDSEDESGSDAEDAEFPRLSLAEQAQILMADAEGDGEETNIKGEVLRTKNEQAEDSIPVKKPDVVLTEADLLEELGDVQSVVDKLILINAKTSGEYRVLNEGSVVALQNRTVVGVVADLLGRVQSPLYIVRFATKDEILAHGITVGTKIFYSPKHSTYVFTKALKAQKGSDASNLWDEEVDENEIEFSDDEAEAEYKRKQKEKRTAGKGAGGANGRKGPGPVTSMPNSSPNDEPYTPLARPPNLSDLLKFVGQMKEPAEVPDPNPSARGHLDAGDSQARGGGVGRGRGRGRDDRRGGGRDNGRGFNDRRASNGHSGDRDSQYHKNGSSLPQGYHPSNPTPYQVQQTQSGYQQQSPQSQYGYNYGSYMSQQYQQPQQSQQPQFPFQFPILNPTQSQSSFQFQNSGMPPQPPAFAPPLGSPPIPKLPQGAHVNPAFLARQAQATQQQQPGYFNPQMIWGQQQSQQQFTPSTQGQFCWPPPPPPPPSSMAPQQADAVMKAVQDQLDILKGLRK